MLERVAAGTSDRSLIFSGLRGVGKTVLLLEYDLLAREQGWASTDVREVSPQADFRQTFAELAFGLLRSMSRKERMRARARRALGVVKAFSLGAPGLTARIDVEAATGTADSGDPEGDLAALLVEVGEVARAGRDGRAVPRRRDAQPPARGAGGGRDGLPPPQPARAARRPRRRGTASAPPAALPGQAVRRAGCTYRELGRLERRRRARRTGGAGGAARRAFEQDAVRLAIEGSGGYRTSSRSTAASCGGRRGLRTIAGAERAGAQPIVEESLDRDFFRNRFESARTARADATSRRWPTSATARSAPRGERPRRLAALGRTRAWHRDNAAEEGADLQPARGLVDGASGRGSIRRACQPVELGAASRRARAARQLAEAQRAEGDPLEPGTGGRPPRTSA